MTVEVYVEYRTAAISYNAQVLFERPRRILPGILGEMEVLPLYLTHLPKSQTWNTRL